MSGQLFWVISTVIVMVALAYPLGKYMAKVFAGEKTFSDFLAPVENLFFKISGIDNKKEMNWKDNMKAMIVINSIWLIYAFVILVSQGIIGIWNPNKIPGMSAHTAFNTAISFITNTNLQHYAGESMASYFSQLCVFTFLQFVSAGTGLAAFGLMLKAFKNKENHYLGNFYDLMLKSCTRILLPVSLTVAIILLANGVPMNFDKYPVTKSLQADNIITNATGPMSAMVAIKQLGTNGGGFMATNSAHPFENPNAITNTVETISIGLIAIASVFAFGFYLNQKKMAWLIFGVMFIGFISLLAPTLFLENNGNPYLKQMGINVSQGNLEGKEVRFGAAASSLWGTITTCSSNGSVNAMHDSFTALSGAFLMLGMQLNAFFGGVGVGFINMFMFIIITVFISGLMIGRTPEFLGKKIETREVKIATLVILLHPLLILGGTALASFIHVTSNGSTGWLTNAGFHGFSQILYEFTSSAANNGSGFEGLNDNTVFWNVSTGVVMLLGRFIPIIGPIAIAGSLSVKKETPFSSGTLKTDSLMFGVMLLFVIFIIGALLFIPALVLGPVSEFLKTI